MTVKELRDRCDAFINSGIGDGWQLNDCKMDADIKKERENMEVVICDDWTPARFFNSYCAMGTTISVETKPAKIEYRREKVKIRIADINECEKLGLPVPKMSCDHKCEECSSNGHCIEHEGRWEDNVPVQVEPPEYESKDVFIITTDLSKEIK